MARKRVAILISGRGSNMAALIAAAKAADYAAKIALVIASRPDAAGLVIATSEGIPTATVTARSFADKASFEAAIDRELAEARIELICLAGFMRVLSAAFVERWHDRIINIHPSLLPAFPGVKAQSQALHHGVKVAGCTVHFVDAGLDSGAIIAQATVPVLDDDTEESLQARILVEEHRLLPAVVADLAAGRVRREGRRVFRAT